MHRQHQISRLPAKWQGEVSYETAAKFRYLVRTDSVFNTTDIHFPYPEIALRNTAEGRKPGGRCCASLRIR